MSWLENLSPSWSGRHVPHSICTLKSWIIWIPFGSCVYWEWQRSWHWRYDVGQTPRLRSIISSTTICWISTAAPITPCGSLRTRRSVRETSRGRFSSAECAGGWPQSAPGTETNCGSEHGPTKTISSLLNLPFWGYRLFLDMPGGTTVSTNRSMLLWKQLPLALAMLQAHRLFGRGMTFQQICWPRRKWRRLRLSCRVVSDQILSDDTGPPGKEIGGRFELKNAANTVEMAPFSSKMLQIARKMEGHSKQNPERKNNNPKRKKIPKQFRTKL